MSDDTQPMAQDASDANDPIDSADNLDDGTFSAKYVSKLREENAKWRTQLRDTETRLSEIEAREKKRQEAELADQQQWQALAEQRQQALDQLQAQMKTQQIQTLKLETAQALGLPAELMEFVTGDDAETIKASAEKLLSAIPKSEPQAGSQRASMTIIPGGEPSNETREQKNRRLFGGNPF